MNSISTKKKNLGSIKSTRLSKKKRKTQYGGKSTSVLNQISNRRIQKAESSASSLSSISSSKYSSMSGEEKLAELARRRAAIRSKKLNAKREKRRLRREKSRLNTKKQKTLERAKLVREKKAKKKI